MGRPSDYTDEIAAEICQRMAEGQSLRKICSDPEMPATGTVMRWLKTNEAFQEHYSRARDLGLDWWHDKLLEIAFDGSGDIIIDNGKTKIDNENVQRSRLKVHAIQWHLGKLAPKKYGDNPETDAADMAAGLPQKITRVIVTWDDRNGDKLQAPQTPRQLTYQPPPDIDAEILRRLTDAIAMHVPRADSRPPNDVLDEVFRIVNGALRMHYG